MRSRWVREVMASTIEALPPHADASRAAGAFAYMKGVAPFLGVSAPERRKALRVAWAHLDSPTSDELGEAALELMWLPKREYHYAAYDLIDRYRSQADELFLSRFATELLTTTPWWDSVDGLVSAMVSPLMREYHDDELIDTWSGSKDRWLIRSAIGHQRGWKRETDVHRILQLCDEHWDDKEFFIAKAIGWAMRDISRLEPSAVRDFLEGHHARNRVAIREAERGLQPFRS